MDLEEGNSHFGYCGKSIAHCKSLDFTFLPFTFLPFEGGDGPGRGKLTLQLLGGRALHIANTMTLPFYLLPCSYQ